MKSGEKKFSPIIICFIVMWLAILLASFYTYSYTFSWFTSNANEQHDNSFATLDISLQNNNTDITNTSFDSTYLSGTLVPGDTISFNTINVRNSGNADAYVLVELTYTVTTTDNTNSSYTYWYNLSGALVTDDNMLTITTGATLVEAESSQIVNISYTFDGNVFDDSYKNASVNMTLSAYAVQAVLPENDTYNTDALYAAYLIVNDFA